MKAFYKHMQIDLFGTSTLRFSHFYDSISPKPASRKASTVKSFGTLSKYGESVVAGTKKENAKFAKKHMKRVLGYHGVDVDCGVISCTTTEFDMVTGRGIIILPEDYVQKRSGLPIYNFDPLTAASAESFDRLKRLIDFDEECIAKFGIAIPELRTFTWPDLKPEDFGYPSSDYIQ